MIREKSSMRRMDFSLGVIVGFLSYVFVNKVIEKKSDKAWRERADFFHKVTGKTR